MMAEYVHPLMVTAIEDFYQELPAGVEDYRQEARDFALHLYEKAADPGARFFLDKSPYHLAANEVMNMFPDGKFIFLWRNPLSVIASIITTWEHVRWHPTMFRSDLFIGVPRMVSAFLDNSSRAYSVKFEDLVADQQAGWEPLMDYLNIPFDPETLQRFSKVELHGRMGDPTGVKQYTTLSTEPTQKWRGVLANPLRRAWCRRYLRYLGSSRLAVMGYDIEQLIDELDSQPVSMNSVIPDFGRMLMDIAKEPIRVRIRRLGIGGPNVIRELIKAQS
jgi:hypothetical protein